MTVSCIVSSAGRRLKFSCYGLAKNTQWCEGQEERKWVVSSVSTECASGTPRRPSVRYLVNSLLPIIHFQTSTPLVLHLILSTVVQTECHIGSLLWKNGVALRIKPCSEVPESPACFWMSCCLPNVFSPQPCTSGAPPMGLRARSQTQHVCSLTQWPPWIIVLPQLGIFTVREWCAIIRVIEQTV